jgi:hypothetical protein
MAYIATSDVTDYGNFEVPASDVTILSALIPRATAIIEKYLGRDFEASTDATTQYYDYRESVTHDDVLFLDDDFVSITSVNVESSDAWSASCDYITLPRNGTPIWGIKLRDDSDKNWSDPSTNGKYDYAITVTGIKGYSATPPEDIKHACVRLVYWMYKQRETDADLDRPLLTNDGITIMPSRLPADVVEILKQYRKVRVA